MNRIFITGDKHRNFSDLYGFCENLPTDYGDWIIVLGDNGVNWYGDNTDEKYKKWLSKIPINFMMIRGNHDMRPNDAVYELSDGTTIPKYDSTFVRTDMISGLFWTQKEFPHLFFAQDGEIYKIGDHSNAIVIGGAYSIDKDIRFAYNMQWFPNEQLDSKERVEISKTFSSFVNLKKRKMTEKLLVFSHTCPTRFIPQEAKSLNVRPGKEDLTMENWMDELFESAQNEIDNWYCGHWHINKVDGPMIFLYEDIREI